MTYRFYFKLTPKGVSVLRLETQHSINKVTKKSTKKIANLEPDFWNAITKLPLPGCDDYDGLLYEIMQIKAQGKQQQFLRFTDSKQALEFLLSPFAKVEKARSNDFFEFFNKVIDDLYRNKKNGTAEIYETARNKMQEYVTSLYFDQITSMFLEKFKLFCASQGLKKTTIHTYLTKYRAVYNMATKVLDIENTSAFNGVFKDVATRARRQKNRYLLKEGLLKFNNAKMNHPAQQRVIDLALLQFYLGGMDFIDIYHMKRSKLVNGRYYYNRMKLGDKGYEIDIKVFPCAMEIINKYDDGSDEVYFFSWKKLHSTYRNFRSNQIRRLKKIQEINELKLLPTDVPLNTKAFRHTFSTIGKYLHVDPDLLRELMGHERNDIDTVYKDKFQERERDAAHWKIIDINTPIPIMN